MGRITAFSTLDIAQNKKLYDEYHEQYGMVDGWDTGNKEENFETMMHLVEITGVPISGASCVDVGCGTGDLSLFLRKRGLHRYIGIDIYETSLVKARVKYPHEQFILGDILQNAVKGTFDYAFCSGTFTVRLSIDNYDFLETMVAKMWKLTRIGLVFNVLTDDDPSPDPDLFFYSVEKVIAICQKVAPSACVTTEKSTHVSQTHVFMYR